MKYGELALNWPMKLRKMGFDKETPKRVSAGIIYTLQLAAQSGHIYTVRDTLITKASHY